MRKEGSCRDLVESVMNETRESGRALRRDAGGIVAYRG